MTVLGIAVLVVTPVVWIGLWRGAKWGSDVDFVAPVWLAILGISGWPALGAYWLGYEDAFGWWGVSMLVFMVVAVLCCFIAMVRFPR